MSRIVHLLLGEIMSNCWSHLNVFRNMKYLIKEKLFCSHQVPIHFSHPVYTMAYSLIICAAFERRFKRRLITSIIYPQDDNGNPIYNPHGRYLVRLWLNGVARRVQVDDFFPVDKFGNILCSYTHCESAMELWVCVIEKAYMKLCKCFFQFLIDIIRFI